MSDTIKSRNKVLILYEKQGKKCYYCKTKLLTEAKEGRVPHLDHYVPRSKGGKDYNNIVLACGWCDETKTNTSPEIFEKFVKPYVSGRVKYKQDLREYWQYLRLKKKFTKK